MTKTLQRPLRLELSWSRDADDWKYRHISPSPPVLQSRSSISLISARPCRYRPSHFFQGRNGLVSTAISQDDFLILGPDVDESCRLVSISYLHSTPLINYRQSTPLFLRVGLLVLLIYYFCNTLFDVQVDIRKKQFRDGMVMVWKRKRKRF